MTLRPALGFALAMLWMALLLMAGCSPPVVTTTSDPMPGQATALRIAAEVFGAPAGWQPPPIEWVGPALQDCVVDMPGEVHRHVPRGTGDGLWAASVAGGGSACTLGYQDPGSGQLRVVWPAHAETVADTALVHEAAHAMCDEPAHDGRCFAVLHVAAARLREAIEQGEAR